MTALIATVGCLVLVGSSLLARRLPLAQTVRMAALWALLFAAVAVAVVLRHDIAGVAGTLYGRFDTARPIVEGDALRVRMADDGHFWVRGTINGVERRFLIDSGATTNAISAGTAAAAGIDVDVGGVGMIRTANGAVQARLVRLSRLAVGPVERRDLRAVTSPAFGDVDILGMNFLSSFRRWSVEDRQLSLYP